MANKTEEISLMQRYFILRFLPDRIASRLYYAYPTWEENKDYIIGERIQYMNKLFKIVQNHKSQNGLEPDKALEIYEEIPKST